MFVNSMQVGFIRHCRKDGPSKTVSFIMFQIFMWLILILCLKNCQVWVSC